MTKKYQKSLKINQNRPKMTQNELKMVNIKLLELKIQFKKK